MRAALLSALAVAGGFGISQFDASSMTAHAGAWPEAPGRWFVASGTELGYDPILAEYGYPLPVAGWSSLYIDYGMTERLTVTFDYGRQIGGTVEIGQAVPEQAYLIFRWDLAPEARLRRSVSAGLGETSTGRAYHLGFHMGRGFDGPLGSGWVNLDLHLRRATTADQVTTFDLTAGLNRGERLKLMLSLMAESTAGEPPNLHIAPKVVFPFGKMDLELGVLGNAKAPEQSRVKLSIWQRF